MWTRRGFLGALLGAGVGLLPTVRVMGAVGSNPLEVVGGAVGDGGTGRITDAATGVGLFNPNLDPAAVGQDADGNLYAAGTDMSLGAPIRRQMHTNVINGDFATLPPGGVDSVIVSDQSDAGFNPLPGWYWAPDDGGQAIQVVADATYASGYKVQPVAITSSPSTGYLTQMIAVPMSKGQQYRLLLSAWGDVGVGTNRLYWQFYGVDGTTPIGSELDSLWPGGAATELKIDVGLVPTTAAYLKVRVRFSNAAIYALGEVRCAFLPAEATLGLKSIIAASAAIDTSETTVVSALLPAGTLVPGSVYKVWAAATLSDSGGVSRVATFRIRLGAALLSGSVLVSMNPSSTGTASSDDYILEGTVTCRAAGASGTVIASLQMMGRTNQPFAVGHRVEVETATVTIDTTAATYLELTAVTANASCTTTFRQAYIQCIMAS